MKDTRDASFSGRHQTPPDGWKWSAADDAGGRVACLLQLGAVDLGWFSRNCQLKDHPTRDGSGVGRGSQGDILG